MRRTKRPLHIVDDDNKPVGDEQRGDLLPPFIFIPDFRGEREFTPGRRDGRELSQPGLSGALGGRVNQRHRREADYLLGHDGQQQAERVVARALVLKRKIR